MDPLPASPDTTGTSRRFPSFHQPTPGRPECASAEQAAASLCSTTDKGTDETRQLGRGNDFQFQPEFAALRRLHFHAAVRDRSSCGRKKLHKCGKVSASLFRFHLIRVPCAAAISHPLPQTWDSQSQCPRRGLYPMASSQFYCRHPKGLGKWCSLWVRAPKLFGAAANLLHIVIAVAWLLCHGLGSPHPQLNRIRKSHFPSRTLTGSSPNEPATRAFRLGRYLARERPSASLNQPGN